MKRFAILSGICMLAFTMLNFVAARPSRALGGEALGCFVAQGTQGVYTEGDCAVSQPQPSYDAVFHVLDASGSYTYSWDTGGFTPSSGCSATSDTCIIHVSSSTDHFIPVSVTLTQGGQHSTVSATAETQAVCGNNFC